jgi:hypothetical protein
MMNKYEFMRSQGQRTIVLYIPETLHAEYKAACRCKGLTMTAAIQALLKKFVDDSKNEN